MSGGASIDNYVERVRAHLETLATPAGRVVFLMQCADTVRARAARAAMGSAPGGGFLLGSIVAEIDALLESARAALAS